jgi:murein L,D-transpeptidase YafK
MSAARPSCGFLAVLLAVPVAAAEPRPPTSPGCPPVGDSVMVFTREHELWLCHDGEQVGRHRVALGRGGLDKRRGGDGRTPLGTYELGEPRPSRRFGIFIPVVYPTPEQAAQGFSGTEVGIHGPRRRAPAPGRRANPDDWTLGCIATETDLEAERVAEFIRERKPLLVVR